MVEIDEEQLINIKYELEEPQQHQAKKGKYKFSTGLCLKKAINKQIWKILGLGLIKLDTQNKLQNEDLFVKYDKKLHQPAIDTTLHQLPAQRYQVPYFTYIIQYQKNQPLQ